MADALQRVVKPTRAKRLGIRRLDVTRVRLGIWARDVERLKIRVQLSHGSL